MNLDTWFNGNAGLIGMTQNMQTNTDYGLFDMNFNGGWGNVGGIANGNQELSDYYSMSNSDYIEKYGEKADLYSHYKDWYVNGTYRDSEFMGYSIKLKNGQTVWSNVQRPAQSDPGACFSSIQLGNGNFVRVYFGQTSDGVNSDLEVSQDLVDAVSGAVRRAARTQNITSITISATTNGVHSDNSYHYLGNAVDISAVNGIPVGLGQPVVDALQAAFEWQVGRFENYGPSDMLRNGNYIFPSNDLNLPALKAAWDLTFQHMDHIHWSVY